ncbi:hypothetical protein LXL04_017361 [Taraxacum kok-saghyz]
MENGKGSKTDEEFDWLFVSQNPTNPYQPSTATVNGGCPAMGSSSNSMRSVINHDDGFLSYQNTEQSQLPAGMGVNNPGVRSSMLNNLERYPILPDIIEYNPYEFGHSCNSCAGDSIIPGFPCYGYRSSPFSRFPETPYDRNLELEFNRLTMASPSHHQQLLPYAPSSSSVPTSYIRNNPFGYNQLRNPPAPVNPGCNDICCNPQLREFNLAIENSLRSRNWMSDYQSPNPNNNTLLRQQAESRPFRFPASLKNIRGAMFYLAKDKDWCQFLQNKCEERKPEEIDMIFGEIKDRIREVMVDGTMNYLAQKLFMVINELQLNQILFAVISDVGKLTSICLNCHGTRAMQKLVEVLTTSDQRTLIVSALRRICVTLAKNTNGYHVIQNCLKLFSVSELQPILDAIADNCVDVATDKSGCCVLQHCISLSFGKTKERLITPIIENSLHLAENPYGNYVVQHVLGMQVPAITSAILKRLSGNFVNLGMNKFASNVVEKLLKESSEDVIMAINREFLNSHNFISLITHPYGNYVAQKVINSAKGGILETMINKIQKEYPSLNSHPHGKRVLALAKSSRARLANRHQ